MAIPVLPQRTNCMLATTLARLTSSAATKMGFTKNVLTEGTGAVPQKGQTVTVHCTGYVRVVSCV